MSFLDRLRKKPLVFREVHIRQYFDVPRTEVYAPGSWYDTGAIAAVVVRRALEVSGNPSIENFFVEPPKVGGGQEFHIDMTIRIDERLSAAEYVERLNTRLAQADDLVPQEWRGRRG